MSKCRHVSRAFTLVEVLISLSLLAVLFALLGSLLTGMSRLARLTDDDSMRDREMNFCFDLIRKELGEMILEQSKVDYSFVSGDSFISYTTTRPELLVKNSIPGGVRRVEWRYDAAARQLIRSASLLFTAGRDPAPAVVTRFFEGLTGFEVYFFDGVQWLRMTGISEKIPQTHAVAVRLAFASRDEPDRQKIFESAFLLPNETFDTKK